MRVRKNGGSRETYVKEILGSLAVLVILLEVDIAARVDDQDLSVLRHDALLGALGSAALRLGRDRAGARGGLLGGGGGATALARGAALGLGLLGGALAGIALLQAAHLAVHGDVVAVFVLVDLLRGRGRGGDGGGLVVDAGDGGGEVVAPGGAAGKRDVALDELALALPAHVQGYVVGDATGEEEDAEQGGAEARAVAAVVVLGALPRGEAVGEEVVITDTAGPAQDVGHDGQAGLALRGALDGGLDLAGRGRLDLGRAGLAALQLGLFLLSPDTLGHELLADLVGVKLARPLLVRLVDVLLVRAGCDAQELVKRHIGTFFGDEFVADTEDFAVCGGKVSVRP